MEYILSPDREWWILQAFLSAVRFLFNCPDIQMTNLILW